MKKIVYRIGFLLVITLLGLSQMQAQLPLQYGDMVVSYRYGMNGTNSSVLAVLRTSNTSHANPGEVWTLPTYTAGSMTKPKWYSDPTWTQANLGDIFGITIDNWGNIYVSSSSIYNGAISSKIFEINGVTGVIKNITPTINPSLKGSFGNIKFTQIGADGFLYVSDWDNGTLSGTGPHAARIRCFKRTLNTNGGIWNVQAEFNPEFGRPNLGADLLADGQVPYGLAIRNTSAGKVLYYSRIGNSSGRTYGAGIQNGFANEIWSVKLSNTGGFITALGPPNGEEKQTLPINAFRYENPIADIAFSSDGKRMLLAQQSLHSLTSLEAHHSEVVELIESPNNFWIPSGHVFPVGNFLSPDVTQSSAVGGISYSNNVLYGDSANLGCDSTIWAVTDFMQYTLGSVPKGAIQLIPSSCKFGYGVQGFKTANGILPYGSPPVANISSNNYQNSLLIDEDDEYDNVDKYNLGDVEIFNKPLCTTSCQCGTWSKDSGLTLNGSPIPGVDIVRHTDVDMGRGKSQVQHLNIDPIPTLQQIYPLQFVQGQASGVINANYQCTGNCGATYTWRIKNDVAGNVRTGNGSTIDLATLNTFLACGKYTLVITPKCGDNNCGSRTIPITIICEPPSCCKATITIESTYQSLAVDNNISSNQTFSEDYFGFKLNFSEPMSELRVSVEEFKLTSKSPNCITCNNRPVTWGNIQSALLNDGNIQMALSGLIPGQAPGSFSADYREAVYNTLTPLAPPSVSLELELSLPAITELSCCEVDAYVCFKFTFKDTQCRECTKMVCTTIKLVPPSVIIHDDGGNSGTGGGRSRTKNFDVLH